MPPEGLLRTIVRDLKDVVFRTDGEGRWLFLNPAWEEVTGFTVDECIGRVFLDYVYPDDRAANIERLRPLMERRTETCRHAVRYLTKDGGFRWVEATVRLVLTGAGDVVGTCGTLVDVTDYLEMVRHLKRRETVLDAVSFVAERFLRGNNWEAALPAAMERLGAAADAVSVALLQKVCGQDGVDLVRLHRLWTSRNSLSGDPVPAFLGNLGPVPTPGVARWEETLDKGGMVSDDVDGFSGPERDLLIEAGLHSIVLIPIFVGKLRWGQIGFGRTSPVALSQASLDGLRTAAGIVGAAIGQSQTRLSLMRAHADLETHVLQRTRELSDSNRALRESEQLYRTLIETSPDGILLTDPDERITMVNRRSLELFGADAPEQLIGANAGSLARKEDPVRLARLRGDLLTTGRIPATEIKLTRQDGSTFQAEMSASVARDSQGQPRHVVGVVRDITARKQLEEQFRQAQKMEAIGRLAGGVAHDFNNLLTVIKGYGELLRKQLAEHPADRRKMAQILKACERAAGLIDQLLSFSRKQMTEPRVIAVNTAIADMEKMLRRLIGEDIEFRTLLAPGAGTVRIDPSQFDQVIMNLAVNARDAMQSGGTLEIATYGTQLDSSPRDVRIPIPPGRYVVTDVRDTGTGMDAETCSRIFEPFFTTKEVGRGTGLGLATVYGIVQQTGGSISVESAPGRGTRFRIYLPAATEIRSLQAEGDEAPVREGSETVLVVEDEDLVRTMIVEALEDAGYRVLEARNGQHALEVAERHRGRIDLLLSDVVMPRIGGPELAQRLSCQFPELRVLLVSGYTEHDVRADAAFLRKPFTPASLESAVRRVLDAPAPVRHSAIQ